MIKMFFNLSMNFCYNVENNIDYSDIYFYHKYVFVSFSFLNMKKSSVVKYTNFTVDIVDSVYNTLYLTITYLSVSSTIIFYLHIIERHVALMLLQCCCNIVAMLLQCCCNVTTMDVAMLLQRYDNVDTTMLRCYNNDDTMLLQCCCNGCNTNVAMIYFPCRK